MIEFTGSLHEKIVMALRAGPLSQDIFFTGRYELAESCATALEPVFVQALDESMQVAIDRMPSVIWMLEAEENGGGEFSCTYSIDDEQGFFFTEAEAQAKVDEQTSKLLRKNYERHTGYLARMEALRQASYVEGMKDYEALVAAGRPVEKPVKPKEYKIPSFEDWVTQHFQYPAFRVVRVER